MPLACELEAEGREKRDVRGGQLQFKLEEALERSTAAKDAAKEDRSSAPLDASLVRACTPK